VSRRSRWEVRAILVAAAGLVVGGCAGNNSTEAPPADGSTGDDGASEVGSMSAPESGGPEASVEAAQGDTGAGTGDDATLDAKDAEPADSSVGSENEEEASTDGRSEEDSGHPTDAAVDGGPADAEVGHDAREPDAGDATTGTDGGSQEDANPADSAEPRDSSHDASSAHDGSEGDGGPADAGSAEAAPDAGEDAHRSDGGCTPPDRATSRCGATTSCNGTTSLCLEGIVSDTCEPLPPECACAETLDCDCLLAHVTPPCDAGHLQCAQIPDGGLYWIQDLFCP
jgi:hypothetical protein